ncbi:hypothetical protein CRE_26845 [Caenorhabditis remanei]|uniref:Uncharacterized protein n=1 Tax=Caenorhabditis remanei TaxID=31234 RepID=E3NL05_CAERE|nr:hypothetical protein CRE_26845 [Caenorhabditis remanei]
MSDSNPPAEPNRNRKRKSDSSSDTPSSSSRPPQPVPISSSSSTQSSSSITVEDIIETLSKPLEGRNLDMNNIAEKVLKFTVEYGEKYRIHPFTHANRRKEMSEKEQIPYLRLSNWFEYYEESKDKEAVLDLHKKLYERWEVLALLDSNPPAEPNRNRKRKSDSCSDTPSSSSRPPQPVPISSSSSTQSSSSITVENVIETLSKPLEGRNLNVNNIAEKVLKFTDEYGEKVAASIEKNWSNVRREMNHCIRSGNQYEKMTMRKQMVYLRLFNWFEYYEESQVKEAVLDLHKELEKRWRKMDKELEESKKSKEEIEVTKRKKAVDRIIKRLSTRLEGRDLNEDAIAEKVKEFTEEYGLKVAASIGQNWDIVREEMNSRLPVRIKDMEDEKQRMYMRMFNWLDYYEDSDVKEEVLNLHLELNERWLDIKHKWEWIENLTVDDILEELRKPLGDRTLDVKDVIVRVNEFIERYRRCKNPTTPIAVMFGESWATFTRKRNIYLVEKTYEEMSPDLQEFYLKLFNWLEFYKEDWQRCSTMEFGLYQAIHTFLSVFGVGINIFLLYLALTKSPKIMRPCSAFITNKSLTDIMSSLANLIITDGSSVTIIPTGPCTKLFDSENKDMMKNSTGSDNSTFSEMILTGSAVYWSSLVVYVQLVITAILVVIAYTWISNVLINFILSMGATLSKDVKIINEQLVKYSITISFMLAPVISPFAYIFFVPHYWNFCIGKKYVTPSTTSICGSSSNCGSIEKKSMA